MGNLKTICIGLLGSVFLAACSTTGPVQKFAKGDELAFFNFSEPGTFEEGQYGGIYGGVTMQIVDGTYQIRLTQGDGELWWGQWGEVYDDVVIDVDVDQLSERNENAYGVMCRVRGEVMSPEDRAAVDPEVAMLATQVELANIGGSSQVTLEGTPEVTPEETASAAGVDVTAEAETTVSPEMTAEATAEATAVTTAEATAGATLPPITQADIRSYSEGDGYLFLIQGSGAYAIMRSSGGAVIPLVNWTTSDIIHIGPDTNHLRAVCMGDYLALYVNGEFMADVIDDTYTRGQIGLVASATNRLGIRVQFDNLQVSEARPG